MPDSKDGQAVARRGPRSVLWNVVKRVREDSAAIVAAGVAYYALIALFPGLATLVSIYGLVSDPYQVEQQWQAVSGLIPDAAWQIINDQLIAVAGASSNSLTLAAAASVAIALYGATRGTRSAMIAMNIAYGTREERGFFRLNLTALALTLIFALIAVVALLAVVVLPAVMGFLGLSGAVAWVISVVRWLVMAGVVTLALSVLYRFGPCRRKARWVWLSWGTVAATAVWIGASMLFSFYVANFGDYNATYGSVGALVILLLWCHISAYAMMLGAELNAELDRRATVANTVADDRSTDPQMPAR